VIKLLGAALSDVNNEYIVNSGVILFDSVPENLAVPAIVDLIKNGGAVASEIAREHYEFTTGEPYQSKEMTDKWLKENASDDDDQ
jgi:hypothetical protein